MKFNTSRQTLCLAFVCAMLLSISASAQTYVRHVKPSDVGTDRLYSDDILSSIALPWGASSVENNPNVQDAAFELADILRKKDVKLLSVYVCGSASPDGLWQENVTLSQARTDATVRYLRYVTGVSADKIHQKSLNEDWDRLYELVEDSDMPFRNEVLNIIKNKSWSERKQALMGLAGGKVWRVLVEDFFPKLRCVRIGIYCEEPSAAKPAVEKPAVAKSVVQQPVPKAEPEVGPKAEPKPETPVKKTVVSAHKVDTVYIRDTIYYVKETVYIPQGYVPASTYINPSQNFSSARPRPAKPVYDTPWMMGIKTNILGDALVVPTFGAEIQLADKFSFDFQFFKTSYNVFNSFDENANVYGFSPEVRYWLNGPAMRNGQFIGLHARCAWYTLQWTDGFLYQNGPENVWEGNYHNAGNATPAWSFGFTYGYSLGIGHKGLWGLEFLIGIGYANYKQNLAVENNGIWELVEHQNKHHFGITRAGINLTYRFSLRKVRPEYYENN